MKKTILILLHLNALLFDARGVVQTTVMERMGVAYAPLYGGTRLPMQVSDASRRLVAPSLQALRVWLEKKKTSTKTGRYNCGRCKTSCHKMGRRKFHDEVNNNGVIHPKKEKPPMDIKF